MNDISVRSVASGWNYTVTIGFEEAVDENGDTFRTTPDRIVGGWAATKQGAKEKAREVLS